jgi:cytochrome P450
MARWAALADVQQSDPFPSLRRLRETTPVSAIEDISAEGGPSAFAVLRYVDVADVLGDQRIFSPSVVAERYGPVLGGTTAIGLAGRAHQDLRKLMGVRLRAESLREWASETIEPVVGELVEQIVRTRDPDLVRDVTSQLPARVIGRILGFKISDATELTETVGRLFAFAQNPREGLRAARHLRRLCKSAISEHRNDPDQDDLMTALLSARVDGEALSDETVISILLLLLGAGTKTTADALANTLHTVLRFDLLELVAESRNTTQTVVEESLRWQSPAQMLARAALADTEICGVDIPAGSLVLAHLGSANRDESAFTAGEDFNLDRISQRSHLAFGWGEHRCLGLHLARIELTDAMTAIARRLPNLRPDSDRDTWPISGGLFRTVPQMPVRLS